MTQKKKLIIGIVAGIAVLAALLVVLVVLTQQSEAVPLVEAHPYDKGMVEPVVEPEPEPDYSTWPLTGLPVILDSSVAEAQQEEVSFALTHRSPLCVKIENSYDARPQSGLSQADVVYETLAEGGITRFNCIFQSYIPGEVGPVRSARNSDISIVPQYQGILFYSGANPIVLHQLATAWVPKLTEGAGGFYRVNFRYAPHNLYYDLTWGWGDAEWIGIETVTENPSTLEFLDLSKPNTNPKSVPVSGLIVPFSDGFIGEWEWVGEGASGRWMRSMDGKSYDANTNEQVGATNVVVMWTPHWPDAGEGITWEMSLNGSGRACIFTQGGRIDGTWETEHSYTPPRFFDDNGEEIRLTPGNTWFQVLPPDRDISTR